MVSTGNEAKGGKQREHKSPRSSKAQVFPTYPGMIYLQKMLAGFLFYTNIKVHGHADIRNNVIRGTLLICGNFHGNRKTRSPISAHDNRLLTHWNIWGKNQIWAIMRLQFSVFSISMEISTNEKSTPIELIKAATTNRQLFKWQNIHDPTRHITLANV